MERFWKYKLDHIIFWTATVLFHMYTREGLLQKVGFEQFLLEIIVRNGLLAMVIYLNLNVLIPEFVKRNRILAYIGLLSGSILLYALIKNIHDVYLFGYVAGDTSQRYFFGHTFYNISIAMFYVAFSIALELSREWYLQREVIRQIEIDKLNTELEYLKAQINPHFLFNSINTIYFQIDRHNKVAREMLSAFSDMLRYQLYECNGVEIPVEKEVMYIKNYVDLQRMRKDNNYNIGLISSPDLTGFSIAPLLLIPFVENAFKHVSHRSSDNEIKIELSRKHDVFHMDIYNTRDKSSTQRNEPGIGLRNVKRRLELVYNGRHTLEVKELPDSFSVNLSIKIEKGLNSV